MLKPLAATVGAGLWSALGRFPVPVFCALCFCIISIGVSAETLRDFGAPKGTLLAALFCAAFWFISATLLAESKGWNALRLYALGFAGAAAMGVYLWSLPRIDVPFGLLGAGCFLSMFIAPFLHRDASADAIWTFNYRLWVRIAVAVLAGFVLFLGLLAISQSFKFLFGVEQPSRIAEDIWLFVATLVSPVFAMAGIPRDFAAEEVDYPKPIRLIVSFILLPLLLVYAVILYLYAGKIAVTWTLPEGGVVYLVSGFGVVGTIAWLASVPLHAQSGFVATFARNFYRVLLLPLILLAVGIGFRIGEYGVTEERYVVVLCLLWLVFSSVFALLATSRHAPRFIYLSLISLLFLAAAGPWGAVSLSMSSQLHRLEAAMTRAGMLVNGQAVKPETPPAHRDVVEISALMDYFVSVKRFDDALALLGQPPDTLSPPDSDYYRRAQLALEKAGITYVDPWNRDRVQEGFRTVFYRKDNNDQVYDVRGFDYLFTSRYTYPGNSDQSLRVLGDLGLEADMDWAGSVLTVSDKARGRTIGFELAPLIRAYIDNGQDLDPLTRTADGLTVRVVVRDFNAETGTAPGSAFTLQSLSYELYVRNEP